MATTKWVLDPSHSEVEFKVRHLMITNVTGSFGKFTSEAETEGDDFTTAKVTFTGEVNSISTGNEQRDGHLKSADFFESEKYPEFVFKSTSFTEKGDDYELAGELTLRGVTRPVKFAVEAGGIAKDPYGQVKAGFSVSGKINRKDFGLNWSAVTETGGVVVSDEVRIIAEVQYVKQA
ncbi:MAG: YceI family protein [Chitinophagaceae bacterium]|nr:YceI family protein [Chitinophagaceae bacterium]MCW5926697.1 YceI family protein [Chitinophagaceae bacterium]